MRRRKTAEKTWSELAWKPLELSGKRYPTATPTTIARRTDWVGESRHRVCGSAEEGSVAGIVRPVEGESLIPGVLKGGRRFCCLYTDVANPTSNSIYAKIGYRPIRDDVEIDFSP